MTDPAVVEMELAFAKVAQQEDEAWGEGLSDRRFACALRIDFLIALTFELDLWGRLDHPRGGHLPRQVLHREVALPLR